MVLRDQHEPEGRGQHGQRGLAFEDREFPRCCVREFLPGRASGGVRVMHPPVIVRTYQDKTREQASRRFERDAVGLDREGYDVATVATNPATSVLFWWAWPAAKVSMTVTYVRRPH